MMEKVVHVHKEPHVQVADPLTPTAQPILDPLQPIMNQFPKKTSKAQKEKLMMIGIGLIVVLLGVGTGKVLAKSSGTTATNTNYSGAAPETKKSANEAGVSDESVLKDTGTGVLEKGGIDGEGTHHLVRDGGPTKYIYLSSTVLDLESFVGKKVQVWGQTIAGKKAGWLMDVGKVKVVE